MKPTAKNIDENKLFEYYLLQTVKRSKTQTAKHFGISYREINRIFEKEKWSEKTDKFEKEIKSFFNSDISLRTLYNSITEKIEHSDSLESLSLDQTAKLATTLVKLMPDLEAATRKEAPTETKLNKYEAELALIRLDKFCMDYVYKIIERLRDLNDKSNHNKSQK